LHQIDSAAQSYFFAASEFLKASDEEWVEWTLLKASHLALSGNDETYLDGLADVLEVPRNSDGNTFAKFFELIGPMILLLPRGALMPLLGAHLQHIRLHIPPAFHPALTAQVIDIIQSCAKDDAVRGSNWRLLQAGLVSVFLLKSDPRHFLHAKLADMVSRAVNGLDSREIAEGDRIWTIVIELNQPVTITIETLDNSEAAQLAVFALALFLKAFEREFRDQLVAQPFAHEILVQVASYDCLPESVREAADKMTGLGEALAEQTSVVTRPTEFSDDTLTFIALGTNFLDEIVFGEGVGGALQYLFGLTVIEIVYQLLRGEVDDKEIRPKVVSLIRKTLS
jgi:hypothetical protein